MSNSNKVILDLCGGTGAWSTPYKDAGYDVKVITLPEYNVERVAFTGDGVLFLRDDGSYMSIEYKNVYGILAAPPCTEFSIAKGDRLRDLRCGMKTVSDCMGIIWEVQQHTTLKFWALENPRGLLRRFLGIPKYTFEQWQFGGNKRKATDIWGYFNIPTPHIKIMPTGLTKQDCKSRVHAADWTKPECPSEYADYIGRFHGDAKRAALRAITPPGFARAFYKANK